jgi:CRISPR-associated protein Cmr2
LLLDPDPKPLLPGWLAIKITFTLTGPWYSKDDRPFHVFDNPLRKDRVFGVPFMAAASWKGLLRWAMRMTTGLIGPEPVKDERKRREAELAVLHLFGNEKGARDLFQRGALAFYPTWFSKIGFEVINPHSRKTRAGTQPILYEVVPAGTKGTLKLLYSPLPEAEGHAQLDRPAAINQLLDAVWDLLTVYGFSAKRTAGWGSADINRVAVTGYTRSDLKKKATVEEEVNQDGLTASQWGEVKYRIAELLGTGEVRP